MAGATPSSPGVTERMRRQRSKDTGIEMAVRRTLHSMGLRYRVHRRPVPDLRREADIVFSRARVAVFVDGCFWHGCPQHGTHPKANSQWWETKLRRNRERDVDTIDRLTAAGWITIRVWEHENPKAAAARIAEAVTRVGASGE